MPTFRIATRCQAIVTQEWTVTMPDGFHGDHFDIVEAFYDGRTRTLIRQDVDEVTNTYIESIDPTTIDPTTNDTDGETFTYTVTIRCATDADAERVVAERVGYDEDYGFPYQIVSAMRAI